MNLRLLLGCLWRLPRLVRGRRERKLLDNPDSRLSVERARLRVAGRFPSHWFRSYSRSKMKSDPLYESVIAELRPLDGAILDLGCGQGVLAFYLKERGLQREIRGIDQDLTRIRAAQKLVDRYYEGIRFEIGDLCAGIDDFEGHVIISDVLQYLGTQHQGLALRGAAACIPPGGRLVIRTAIRDGSVRFRMQRVIDVLARLVRWIPAKTRHYPSESELVECLEGAGLRLMRDLRPQWRRTPLNLYLAVFGRDPVDALKRPSDDPAAKDPAT
jgi:2-polyprenyl-3-methyl-5-hydroxy-6-metoxy-1,4-benzoquinol methylase